MLLGVSVGINVGCLTCVVGVLVVGDQRGSVVAENSISNCVGKIGSVGVGVGINAGCLTRVVNVLVVGDQWGSVVVENRISKSVSLVLPISVSASVSPISVPVLIADTTRALLQMFSFSWWYIGSCGQSTRQEAEVLSC